MTISRRMAAVTTAALFVALLTQFMLLAVFAGGLADDLSAQGLDLAASLGKLKLWMGLASAAILIAVAAVAWLLSQRLLAVPLGKIKAQADLLSCGRVDFEPEEAMLERTDEIGGLAASMVNIRENTILQAQILDRLSEGDVDVRVEARSDKERVNVALLRMVERLRMLDSITAKMNENVYRGAITKKESLDQLPGIWKRIAQQMDRTIDVFVKIFDSLPLVVAAFTKEYDIAYMNKTGETILGKDESALMGTKCYDSFKTDQCNTDKCACRQAMTTLNVSREETISRAGAKPMDIDYIGVPLQDNAGKVVGAFEIVMDQTQIKTAQRKATKQADFQATELEKLLKNLDRMAKGNLNIVSKVEQGDEDTKILEMTFNSIGENLDKSVSEIKNYISEIAEILGAMSEKDMTRHIARDYLGDFITLKDSINHILGVFNETLSEIGQAAVQVESGTQQVAESSQNLSQGSAEQASSVEEISATISEIAEKTKNNAQNANKANEISTGVMKDANEGNRKMRSMLQAMEEIKASSNNINNIIKVIDDIAFQTNILALNAAVEAARAGEHGKGFAVVAEEVRNLAARSASAAKETTSMIDLSISKVNEGYTLANETAEALEKIVGGVEDTVGIVEMIAEASIQQATAVSQIDNGINQISEVTQMNTSTAEESASASEEMASQAQYLKEMINAFRLTGA